MASTVAAAYANIARSTGRIAASLKSAAESMKQLASAKPASGGPSAGGAAATIAVQTTADVAGSAAGFATERALPKLWAMIAGSSASVATTTAATTTAVSATAGVSSTLSAWLASAASAAGGMLAALGPILPIVLAIAAAGVAIYTVWKELDAIWPGIVGDLFAAAKWLADIAMWTASLLAPWTYVKGAIGLVRGAIAGVKNAIAATADAARTLLVGAANAAVVAWRKLSSLVVSTARAAGAALVAVGSATAAGLGAARDAASALFEKLAYAGVIVAGLGAAIVGPLTMAAQRFGEAGDAIDRLAKRAGASAEAMSEWAYITERTGVSTTELADAISKVGGETAFEELVYEIASIEDPLQRAAVAKEEFGDGWRALMPLFAQGADGLNAMSKEANALGLTFSGPAAASASALARSYQLLRDGLQGLWQTVGQAVAPAIEDWNQLLVGAIKGAVAWAKANQPLIAQVFRVAEAAAMAGTAVAAIASTIMPAIPLVLGLATAAAAGGAAWSRYGQSIMAVVGPIITSVQELYAEVERVFGGIGDAIRAGDLELAVQIAWLGVQTAWTAGLSSLASITGDAMGGILNALAAGDWQSAGEQAWAQLQIVFEQGMSQLEQIESRLRTLMDNLVTHVGVIWDTISARVISEIRRMQSMIAEVASYDPTGAAGQIADSANVALNKSISGDGMSAEMAAKIAHQAEFKAKLAEMNLEKKKASKTDTEEDHIKAAEARAASNKAANAVAIASPQDQALAAKNAEARAALAARTADREAEAARKQAERDAKIADLRNGAGVLGVKAGVDSSDRMSDLQKRLDDALANAAALRAEADARSKDAALKIEQRIQEGGAEGLKRSSSGATFSAASLVAMSGRGATKMEELTKEQTAKIAEHIQVTKDLKTAFFLTFK